MDSSSTYIVPPKYDWVTDYSEGCARFEKDDKWGYVNKKGQIVIPAQFIGVSPFINGRALVAQTVDSLVFIDTTGTNTTELMSWFEHVDTTKISNDKAETGICNCKNIQYPDLKKCAELLFGQPSSNYRVLFSAQGESSYTQDIELYSRNAFLRRHLYYEGSISTLYLRNSSYMDAKNTLVKIIENSEGKIYHKEETFRSFYFNARFKHHSGTFGVERIDTNLIKITFRQI